MNKQTSRKVPIRTCIATGIKLPKSEMIRLVRIEDNGKEIVKVDLRNKERGRGANLTMDPEAFDLAVKKGAIERSLKLSKKLSPAEIQNLRSNFVEAINTREFRPGNKRVKLKISKQELDQKLSE